MIMIMIMIIIIGVGVGVVVLLIIGLWFITWTIFKKTPEKIYENENLYITIGDKPGSKTHQPYTCPYRFVYINGDKLQVDILFTVQVTTVAVWQGNLWKRT
jgi:hypothetical protein